MNSVKRFEFSIKFALGALNWSKIAGKKFGQILAKSG
jgi:hypothetical protein